jgi:hypothetical protein
LERVSETDNHGAAIWQIAQTATRARRADVLAALIDHHGCLVQSGPFAGMALPDQTSAGDGNLLPKFLGCHEAELHPIIEDIIAAVPDLVIDIGTREGYYAVGMARRLPAAFVHAFDTQATAQDLCRQTAGLNDVGKRISVTGRCTPDLLQAIVPRGRTPVVICDCGGYEQTLIDPHRVPALRSAILVIECHDFVDATLTQTLADRLGPTHTLEGIREGARDPNALPSLQGMSSLDRWLAVCEYRPTTMHWLVALPK